MGVRCADLCKCHDCHNVGTEGALPLAASTAAGAKRGGGGSSSSQQRLQHPATAYWQLGQGGVLPAAAAGGTATPATSAGLTVQQAQAQCGCGCGCVPRCL
jgi:hypothetical protein